MSSRNVAWEHYEDAKKLYGKSKVRYLLTNLKWNEKINNYGKVMFKKTSRLKLH